MIDIAKTKTTSNKTLPFYHRDNLKTLSPIEQYVISITPEWVEKFEEEYFRVHRQAKKRPIGSPYHPSLNSWIALTRLQKNKLKQNWKDFIVFIMDESGLSDKQVDVCTIECITYYKTNRGHDVDNSVPKFILDGLTASGFLIDDNYKHIAELTMSVDIDKDNPRTDLIINVYK